MHIMILYNLLVILNLAGLQQHYMTSRLIAGL